MGSLFGVLLFEAGNEVLLYDIWLEHLQAIQENGLQIHNQAGEVSSVRVPVTFRLSADQISQADLIILETKTYDTVTALEPLKAHLSPTTRVLTLQNGAGNYEIMRRVLPDHPRIIIGVTAHGSNVLGPGIIRRTGVGPTEIGDPTLAWEYRGEIVELIQIFNDASIETTLAENIHAAVWAKLAANATINPLTALTGLKNGEILEDEQLLTLTEQIVVEMLAVMDALDIPRIKDDYAAYARFVMDVTWESYSSMLQDIRFKRRTEIESINGAIARFGRQEGVATPVNDWITALVLNRQRDYLEESRGVL